MDEDDPEDIWSDTEDSLPLAAITIACIVLASFVVGGAILIEVAK